MLNLISAARRTLTLGLLGLAVTTAPLAQAQTFPNKPVRWVVGYPAGGGTDFLARTIAAQMSTQLGQPVLIDNRPGAGAIIGADITAKAPGDGYTMFTADNGVLVYNPVLYKKLPYDPAKDFAPIGLMARAPLLLVAAPSAGIKDAKQMMAMAKADPGKLSYGSPGNGSPHHLAMELLKSRTGLFLVHVPYRGAAPALQDVMGGQIPLMMVDTSSGMSAIKAGKLVPLTILSAKRIPQLPDVPTMAELGFKDVEAYAWQGLVVPVSTPKDVQAKLTHEMQLALANADVKRKLFEAAWEPVPSDAAAMAAYTQSEIKIWHQLIKDRGITLE
ncbi:tripartite tricarboxylate transporter substrate binding protein [Polaromonas sp. SM01]|uniref:Bug family tripartite tricarboxylate transporter substrate binding protein n=1 Tax=Polaromonas sp. SM01 TaxID=3085630 RepID=UPI0029817DB6|nr:tripartite tricarboxylate transporter substrate binding protein [Polaromonas sp. SM01]MDW5443594.1 tripartite tricarboxylate transporter substrate binding protein [Polaromonas sp. SM01]